MTDVRRVTRPNRRRFLFGSAGGIASYALGLSPTRSQPLHSTARILVGFPAGGPSDVIARLLAEQMKAYASTTIVENRPGAGGRVVMDVLKNSAADGSVMVLTPAVAMCLYPHVYKSLSYNPQQDFAPVTTISTTSMLIAIGPMVPSTVTTLADFIAWCRSNPRQSNFGSPGAGSPLHFLGVMLSRAANFEYLHVPLSGNGALHTKSAGRPNRLLHLADRLLRSARPGRDAAGAGNDGRTAQPIAARCANRFRGRISGARILLNGSVFLFRRGLPAGPSRRSAASCARHCKPRKCQAGLANQSVDVGGLTPADFARQSQSRLRSLGTDREGIRVHAPGLGGRAGFMSRANIDEASWPLAVIEHVGERSRICKMQNTAGQSPTRFCGTRENRHG